MSSNTWTCYRAGNSGVTALVGYEGGATRVMRYEFETDSSGASRFRFQLNNVWLYGGVSQTINWYVGTDPSSHANAGVGSASMGSLKDEGGGKFSAEADVVLIPNTTYYFWIFPSVAEYGCYSVSTTSSASDLTLSGGAGLVYIDRVAYQCYIDNGVSWDLCIPYVDSGTSWNMCS